MEVPELLPAISRAGNADHGTQRASTTINLWRRMFSVKKICTSISDEELAQKAARGVSKELGAEAPYMARFVCNWSGGKDATVLQEIERFEKTLQTKRKVVGTQMKLMAELKPHDWPLWVPAMMKASLVMPKKFIANGLWSVGDVSALKSPNGKLLKPAKTASSDLMKAREFIAAHCTDKVGRKEAFAAMDTLDRHCVTLL